MNLIILCICLTAVTFTLGNQAQDGVQSNGDASYEFGYDIHNPLSNDIKSHHEVRDGKNVLGFYTFKEADGSIRIVKYKVTPDTGFEAVVEKIKPEAVPPGNSIDGQEAAPTSHGTPQTIVEPRGGASSQYVAGTAGFNGVRHLQNQRRHIPAAAAQNRNVQVEAPRQQQGGNLRNPYIIRRNNQQVPAVHDGPQESRYSNHHQRVAPDAKYVDVPRGRQRYVAPQQQHNQRQFQNVPNPRHRFGPPVQGQVNNPQQPNAYPAGPIVYIDGVPYVDDIGAFSGAQTSNKPIHVNGHVFVPMQGQGQGQYQQYQAQETVENVENEANEEVAPKKERVEDNDKEEYEEDDEDEDEDHAYYEEEDEEEDEDSEPSDFYEENENLISEQQKEYDRLKKEYENDGKEVEKEKAQVEAEVAEEKKPEEPVKEQ